MFHMLPDENENQTKYYVTYATSGAETNSHSFIIISKQIPNRSPLVLASFGLYGEQDRIKVAIGTQGIFGSSHGRIRSEHFHLHRTDEQDYDFYISVKSFLISGKQACDVMREVLQDSTIAAQKKHTDLKENPNNKSLDTLALLTPEEKTLYDSFEMINANKRGGPQFNARDYNCKRYAIYILRKLGIVDPIIEADRYPHNDHLFLKPAKFYRATSSKKHGAFYWQNVKALNLHPHPSPITHYSNEYKKIYDKQNNPIEGALALLDDYANRGKNFFLHPKRHHAKDLQKITKHIREHLTDFQTLSQLLTYVNTNLSPYRDMTGSLQKRIDFLEAMARLSQEAKDEKKHHP